jgi:hypothetical protein
MSGPIEHGGTRSSLSQPLWVLAALGGGALVMLGAWLPWLTLFAGLQRYGGLIGLHGRILFAGGALAFVAGIGALRTRRGWIGWGTSLLGLGLVGFTWWLLMGLVGTLRHGLGELLVPRAGPGLFVALLGSALVMVGPVIVLAHGRRPRSHTSRRASRS